ncbi:hypothetical protein FHG87_004701 [Trinorchestia longiramus]|nr:hypothetical protein FHG87_004701 [Trinorchestia longiramus]
MHSLKGSNPACGLWMWCSRKSERTWKKEKERKKEREIESKSEREREREAGFRGWLGGDYNNDCNSEARSDNCWL